MTPLALPSAIDLVAHTAAELIDAHIPQGEAAYLIKTALIVEALKRSGGNKCRAARMLGVHRNTFSRQLDEVGGLDPFIQDMKKVAARQFDLFGKKRPSLRVEAVAA